MTLRLMHALWLYSTKQQCRKRDILYNTVESRNYAPPLAFLAQVPA